MHHSFAGFEVSGPGHTQDTQQSVPTVSSAVLIGARDRTQVDACSHVVLMSLEAVDRELLVCGAFTWAHGTVAATSRMAAPSLATNPPDALACQCCVVSCGSWTLLSLAATSISTGPSADAGRPCPPRGCSGEAVRLAVRATGLGAAGVGAAGFTGGVEAVGRAVGRLGGDCGTARRVGAARAVSGRASR